MPSRTIKALARLFGRTDNEVIAQLYSHALRRPLMVHPEIGESLIAAYMAGAVDEYGPAREERERGTIAIMNITGALASRPMPGPSGDGPQNYEQLSATFAELLASDKVKAIVLRMDSPGGLCSGCFDFTDRVFNARGQKPVIAVVDDMAFSAAYAIASAAEEIWVSRTAGVGSVGVVAYHVDQSENDKQRGLKVTYIFAGARKIDFSPHQPLSDEAIKIEQAEVDRIYDLFVDRVGTYRSALGLAVAAVRKSEAALFHGEAAVKAGFADKLGTLQDALHSLGERLAQPDSEEDKPMDAQQKAAHDRGLISTAIAQATGLTGDAVRSLLVRKDLTPENVAEACKSAATVLELCKTAELPDRASGFIEKGASVDEVRAELTKLKAEADERRHTDPTLRSQKPGSGSAPGMWDNAITKLGGKV